MKHYFFLLFVISVTVRLYIIDMPVIVFIALGCQLILVYFLNQDITLE